MHYYSLSVTGVDLSSLFFTSRYFHSIRVFHFCSKPLVFHWRINDSKSLHISMTLLNVLANLYIAIWMVSMLPRISISLNLFSNLWGPFPEHQLLLVSPSPSCIIAFQLLLLLLQSLRIFLNSVSKSPLISRTFLSILVNLNNNVVCRILILPQISNSFTLFYKA